MNYYRRTHSDDVYYRDFKDLPDRVLRRKLDNIKVKKQRRCCTGGLYIGASIITFIVTLFRKITYCIIYKLL